MLSGGSGEVGRDVSGMPVPPPLVGCEKDRSVAALARARSMAQAVRGASGMATTLLLCG